jgi:hypothetical protein
MTTLPPSAILFSHSKIRSRFTGCGKTLEETYQEIKSGVVSGMGALRFFFFYLPPSRPPERSGVAAAHQSVARWPRLRQREQPPLVRVQAP